MNVPLVLLGGVLAGRSRLVAAVGPGAPPFDAFTFAPAAVASTGVRVAATRAEGTGTSIVADLREGWAEATARTWVWVAVPGRGVLAGVGGVTSYAEKS